MVCEAVTVSIIESGPEWAGNELKSFTGSQSILLYILCMSTGKAGEWRLKWDPMLIAAYD